MLRKSNTNDDAKVEAIKAIVDNDSFVLITKNEAVISLTERELKSILENSMKTFEDLLEQVVEKPKESKESEKSKKEPADMFDDFIKYLRENKK